MKKEMAQSRTKFWDTSQPSDLLLKKRTGQDKYSQPSSQDNKHKNEGSSSPQNHIKINLIKKKGPN